MHIRAITGLAVLAALAAIAAAHGEDIVVPDPCDKPCITEISNEPWQGPAAGTHPKVVYGADDRIDVYQETNPLRQQWAAATCALINTTKLTRNQDGTWTVSPSAYLRWGVPACPDEPFGNQPSTAFCTGFMVDDDLIVTAGHCYSSTSLSTVRFVFGYWMEDAATPRLTFLESEVYTGIEVVSYASSGEFDHSVVRVDRPITAPGAHPFIIRREGTIQPGEYVGVIGHPSGLPMKIAFGDTYVRSSSVTGYFVANLDTYGGNSGSPVINATTGMLEGILVRGATDFVLDSTNNCFRSNVYLNTEGRGEDVTKATVFAPFIPGQGGFTGTLSIDEEYYLCDDSMQITVVDSDLEGDTSITVSIQTSAGDQETVTLPATAPGSSEFRGTVSLQNGSPDQDSGALEASHNNTITVSYLDEVSETGLPVVREVQATVDCVAPQISGIDVSYISGTQAQILVTTDETAWVSVYFGETCGNLPYASDSLWQTNHAVSLGTLYPDKQYYFIVVAMDHAGNTSSAENGGACYSFYTYSRLDYFTEFFSISNPLDLANLQVTFTPVNHPNHFAACVKSASALPVPPGDGLLALADDAFAEIPFTHGGTIPFYGTEYDRMYVGSNGYITFGTGDDTFQAMYSLHFQLPRISALMCDLNPARRGAVYATRISDRYVVTFVDVPVYSSTNQYPPENSHTFQMEVFFDGAIRITWLNLFTSNAVAGLSAGLGVPSDYVSANFAALTDCSSLVFDGECHSADTDRDWHISFEELMRVVQFYNVGEYHCNSEFADGYDAGSGTKDCSPHDSDYTPEDWKISISELLRLIQLYNAGGYMPDPSSEDGYKPIP